MTTIKNNNNLIERKQYLQMLRDLKDQNLIKVILLIKYHVNQSFINIFSPNLTKMETLANLLKEGSIKINKKSSL
jgi:hypothetical protein